MRKALLVCFLLLGLLIAPGALRCRTTKSVSIFYERRFLAEDGEHHRGRLIRWKNNDSRTTDHLGTGTIRHAGKSHPASSYTITFTRLGTLRLPRRAIQTEPEP